MQDTCCAYTRILFWSVLLHTGLIRLFWKGTCMHAAYMRITTPVIKVYRNWGHAFNNIR
jgi:hypothetical protein